MRRVFCPPLRLLVGLAVMAAALLPVAAYAGAPGAYPAAVQVDFSAELRSGTDTLSLSGDAVLNRTGDLHFSLIVSSPERHSLDLILVDDVVYASTDGQPYQSGSLTDLLSLLGGTDLGNLATAGTVPSTGLSAACLSPVAINNQDAMQSLARAGLRITQSDGGVIDGVPTVRESIHADIAAALGSLAALAGQLGPACGLGPNGAELAAALSSPELQRQLVGATLDIDVYANQTGNLPRRITAVIDAPAVPFAASFRADITLLAAPAPIVAPAAASGR